jgi:glycosyltransferase 2 family protein
MKRIIPLIQLILTIIILLSLLYFYDFEIVFFHISKMDYSFLILFVLLAISNFILVCLRFSVILDFLKINFKFTDIVKNNLLGSFVNQTPLTVVGGDIFRIVSLKKNGLDLISSFKAIAIDRLIGLFSILLMITFTLLNFFQIINNSLISNIITIFFLLGWIGFLFIMFFKFFRINVKKLDFINQLSLSLIDILRPSMILVKILVASTVANLVTIILVFCICLSMKINISFFNCLLIVPITMYFSLLPISMGGWGVREGIFAIALSALGIPVENSIAVSVVLGCIYLLISLPGSFYLKTLIMSKKQNNIKV